MVIEYIGEVIRNEVANRLEKLYQQQVIDKIFLNINIKILVKFFQNRGIYMFRIDDDLVVDATMSGGLARYVNHCCNPNCNAEVICLKRDRKIVIIANKRISKGEEVSV